MKKILTLLIILALASVLSFGTAQALPRLGASQGFSNPGSVELGGSLTVGGNAAVGGDATVTGSLTVGGATLSSGVFSEDISMAAGYDFYTAAGAEAFDWSN